MMQEAKFAKEKSSYIINEARLPSNGFKPLCRHESTGGNAMDKKKSAKKWATKIAKSKSSELFSLDSLPSRESMEKFLVDLDNGMCDECRAVNEAQEIMYEAWEERQPKKRLALAKEALEVSPDCVDAYVLLAQESAKSIEEVIDLYRKGVEAGERALGKEMFEEEAGDFWWILETRPYMRARAGLAQSLWVAGRFEEAVEHYWDMLRLNPGDNQGIRELLMPCLIELDRSKEAEELFNEYKEDFMAVWKYSRVLLDFRKHGDSSKTKKSLKAALERNKHIPAYILGRKKIPRYVPYYYSPGSKEEAVLYANGNRVAWAATQGALDWLAAVVE